MNLSSILLHSFLLWTVTLLWPAVCNGFGHEPRCVPFDKALEHPGDACAAMMEYNYTVSRNELLGEYNQQKSAEQLKQFVALVQSQCHDWLFTFLCMMHFPPCVKKGLDETETAVYPCRKYCRTVREKCEPLLYHFVGKPWPERYDCNRLVKSGECFQPQPGDILPMATKFWPPISVPPLTHSETVPAPRHNTTLAEPQTITTQGPLKLSCPPSLAARHSQFLFAGVKRCGVPCSGVYFNKWQREKFAPVWISSWASLCVLSCLFTLCTYFIDRKRFRVAECNIVAIAFCYFGIGVVHIAAYASKEGGHNIACDTRYNRIYQQTSARDVPCMAVFMFLYYFTMVAFLNWIVLTLYQFFSSALAWTAKKIAELSLYFRLFTWIVPGLQVVAVLAWQKVDGDQLAGVCYVGHSDTTGLSVLLIAPLVLYLLVGVLLLSASACGRQSIVIASAEGGLEEIRAKRLQSPQERKLVVRVGMFSVFFALLASLLVATLIYEAVGRRSWEKTELNCQRERTSLSCSEGSKPHISVFLMKYAAIFLMGITSGFWVWSNKTIAVWKKWISCIRNNVWSVEKV